MMSPPGPHRPSAGLPAVPVPVSSEVNRPIRIGGPVVPAFAPCSRCLRRTAWSSPR